METEDTTTAALNDFIANPPARGVCFHFLEDQARVFLKGQFPQMSRAERRKQAKEMGRRITKQIHEERTSASV